MVGMLLKLKSIINEKADFTNKLNNKKVRGQNFVKTEVNLLRKNGFCKQVCLKWLYNLTGMRRNSEQRPTQMVVVFYQLTLKNHVFLPVLVMVDKMDLFSSSNKFALKGVGVGFFWALYRINLWYINIVYD